MNAFDYLPSFAPPHNQVFLFGTLLLSGFVGGELLRRLLRLPRISGYVVTGIVLGVSGLKLIDDNLAREAQMFVDIALGLILFELGRRLDLQWLRRDRWFAATAVAECTLSFGCIYLALVFFDVRPLYAALAAALGIATSPAAVMLVAHEIRADGQVTERALNLVAINSVVAVVLVTMILPWLHHEYRASWVTVLSQPVYLLGGSLLVGYIASVAALQLARWLGKREELQLVMLLGLIVLAVGSARALNLSVLLALLGFGAMVKNMDASHDLMVVDVSKIGAMFFVVLFVVGGATLRVDNLATGGALALVYILARFVGKSLGVLSLAHLSGIRPGSGGLLSLALTPMSGLAFVMVQDAVKLYPDVGAQLAAIVLSAALLLEVIGPVAVQFALRQAGESGEET